MQSAKGTKLNVWGTEHHTSCPYHPDNDGKWCGLFAVQPAGAGRAAVRRLILLTDPEDRER